MIYDTTFVRLPTYLHIIKGDKRLYNISSLRGIKMFFALKSNTGQLIYWQIIFPHCSISLKQDISYATCTILSFYSSLYIRILNDIFALSLYEEKYSFCSVEHR